MNHMDGYKNAVLGAGTKYRDPFTHFFYAPDRIMTDQVCSAIYTGSGLAQRIITAPADEAVKNGFRIVSGEEEVEDTSRILSIFEDLEGEARFSEALSWDRLYGGCAMLLVANDGSESLSEELREGSLKNIERLIVYEAPNITTSDTLRYGDPRDPKYGLPEFYNIQTFSGNIITVHESRLIVFSGGLLPEQQRRERNGWGAKVLEKIFDDMVRYDESLSLALMALSRLSQGILKLDGLAELLSFENGEETVKQRLQLIDMSRHMMNTIAIDSSDEYDQKNLALSGVKDIMEEFQSALSAVTEIPVTVLFGRSPGGLNSTGKADFENYYNLVQRIQRRTLKQRISRLVDLLGKCSDYRIRLPDEWTVEFPPLWSPTAKEDAETKNILAQAEKNKADARIALVNSGALDSIELRDKLEEEGEYKLDRSLDKDAGSGGEEE